MISKINSFLKIYGKVLGLLVTMALGAWRKTKKTNLRQTINLETN